MRKQLCAFFLLLSLVFLLTISCGVGEPRVSVVLGNYAYSRGDFQRANISYLKAYESGEYEEWIAYNLGNVYAALGEYEAAYSEWEKALTGEDAALLYHLFFNQGVIAYEQAEYEAAFQLFKEALKVNPSEVAAKINLEHTVEKMSGRNPNLSQGRETQPVVEREGGDDLDRMLEYIQRKEEHRWIPAEEEEGEKDNRDW